MTKDEVISTVFMEMNTQLTNEQTVELKNVLIRVLYPLEFNEETTEISTFVDDTDFYIKKFELSLSVEEKSRKTIDQYIRATKKFFNVVNKNFREITSDDALFYMAYLRKYNKTTATTRDNERKFVKCFFNYLFDNEYIYRNPFDKVKPIKRDEKKKIILTDEEIELIRDECKNDIRDSAIIDFMLATGVRVSELEALNINDVNFQTNEVQIYGIKTNKWRTVYLDAKASKHLSDYLGSRKDNNEALFVSKSKMNVHRIGKATYEKLIQKYVSFCGIKKHCTVHTFRKTLVSKLYSKHILGIGEIAELMGHSISTLQKYYLLIDGNNVKNSYVKSMA